MSNQGPNTPDRWHQKTQHLRNTCNDLYNGTYAMRKRIKEYLPQSERETDAAYMARVLRTFLFPAYQETIDTLVGRIYSDNPTFEGVSENLMSFFQNIDLAGTSLESFLREASKLSEIDGMSIIHIEHTPKPVTNETLADDEINQNRPYLRLIALDNLISVTLQNINGVLTLVQARIREVVEVPGEDEWTTEEVIQVRVLYPGGYAIYRKNDSDGDWFVIETGETRDKSGDLIMEIPLIPVYTNKIAPWRALPPLMDLAGLNIEHFQVKSDLRTTLHYSAIPFLFGKGISKDDAKSITVASSSGFLVKQSNADMKWIELTGASAEVNQNYLNMIEKQMDALALQPLTTNKTIEVTATEAVFQQEDEISELEADANNMEKSFSDVLQWMQRYLGEEETAEVSLNGNFIVERFVAERMKFLIDMLDRDKISDEDFLRQVQKLGILSEDTDIEAWLVRLQEDREAAIAEIMNQQNIEDDEDSGNDEGESDE